MIKYFYFLIIMTSLYSRNLEVEFISDANWLTGKSWGGQAFYSSIDYGAAFMGVSQINEFSINDVDIYLSQDPDSITHCWVYSAVDSGRALGMGTFPGTAYQVSDSDNPRRLILVFFEEDGDVLI